MLIAVPGWSLPKSSTSSAARTRMGGSLIRGRPDDFVRREASTEPAAATLPDMVTILVPSRWMRMDTVRCAGAPASRIDRTGETLALLVRELFDAEIIGSRGRARWL